jgi:hypothetical protein
MARLDAADAGANATGPMSLAEPQRWSVTFAVHYRQRSDAPDQALSGLTLPWQ